jgi:nitrilase
VTNSGTPCSSTRPSSFRARQRRVSEPRYFGPDGSLLGKHCKLMPTGSERTVWGMGDGSTLEVYETPFGRLGGLICWENYMPLTRFYMYSQGVDVWVAPTLAVGDGWIATLRHLALEGSMWTIGVNPCVHIEQIPIDFPDRDRVWRVEQEDGEWVEPGNSAIVTRGVSSSLAQWRTRSRSSWRR